MRNTGILTAAVAALLAACSPPVAEQAGAPGGTVGTGHFGSIAFQPCSLASVDGGLTTEAQCGTLQVAENPAQPDGRQIGLNIAWLPAAHGATADPVFFLAGGPGQAATEHAATVAMALAEVAKQRDIILVDQRGTGKSHPLDCRDADGKPLEMDEAAALDEQQIAAFASQCAQGLQGRADPRFYTTTDAVRDLDTVRAALDVEAINLVGVSYGSRVAQQYAADRKSVV